MNTNSLRQARYGSLALLCLLAIQTAHAGRGIATTGNMGFGRFVARSGGTVAIGIDGMRSSSGSVILLASSATPASFLLDIPGKEKLAFVSLPGNGSVVMSNGIQRMAVSNFISNAPSDGNLNAPTYALQVGATLHVGSNQAPGNYVGNFIVTVEYQ